MIERQDVRRVLLDSIVIDSVALGRCRACRITRVQIPNNKFLSANIRSLTDKIVVIPIRRPHECGCNADNPFEGLFDAPHLIVDLVPGEGGKIFVGPSVGSYHVPCQKKLESDSSMLRDEGSCECDDEPLSYAYLTRLTLSAS